MLANSKRVEGKPAPDQATEDRRRRQMMAGWTMEDMELVFCSQWHKRR